ncbi:MAG: aldo/keto reductase [Firmicutes bacterium]|nr:aldo/keto reductase [Bacillota bacterium]
MPVINLGDSGIAVSRLGFGTLALSPLQTSLSVEEGAELLCYAWHKGVTFWDTAQIYNNYPVLKAALSKIKGEPVIATKTYAYTACQAREAVEEARRALGRDVLDIVLLHEQSALTLPGHREALEWLAEARSKGAIRAVGISTHSVSGVQAALTWPEIQILHPLYNQAGVGIRDGNAETMSKALLDAQASGRGIYAMKVLGGGSLYRDAGTAIAHVLGMPWFESMVIGMVSQEEIDFNLALCNGRNPAPELASATLGRKRRLHIADWCRGCAACVSVCPQAALQIEQGKAIVNHDLCLCCGYCSRVCGEMCLKII